MNRKFKFSAILMALIIVLSVLTGCGSKETTVDLMPTPKGPDASEKPTDSNEPTAEPKVTPIIGWEQIDLSDTSKPWVKQILSGPLKDIPIYKDEHDLFPRICYIPDDWDGYLVNLQLVGYITGTDKIYNAIEDLCAEYIKIAYNTNYKTYKGNEDWYLFSDAAVKYFKENKSDEKNAEMVQKYQLNMESKGIQAFTEFLISADGKVAFIGIEHSATATGTQEFLEADNVEANPNGSGTMYFSNLLTLTFENGKWKIDSVINEEGSRVKLQPVAE